MEEELKLIGVDIDGTLLNSKNELTTRTKASLIKASRIGHKVAIITGRDFYAADFLAGELDFDKFGGLVSSSNGAHVYDMKAKKTIINHTIDPTLIREMIDFAKGLGFDYIIYHRGEILVENKRAHSLEFLAEKNKMPYRIIENLEEKIDFPLNKVLFSAEPSIINKNIEKFKEKFESRVNPIHSMPQFLDCMPLDINKGRSILEIADFFSIDHKDTLAFGDEINDMEMIKMAGTGIAMANASEILKKEADFITLSNDEDGIAYYIEKNILKEK